MQYPKVEYMQRAIDEAIFAAEQGNYAVGAVIIKNDVILAVAHTQIHELKDPTAHAEILAIRAATNKLNSRFLEGAFLYSTLEPCPMCTSAAIFSKLKGIIFGATTEDAKQVFLNSKEHSYSWRQIDIRAEYVISKGNPELEVHSNFMREECLKLFSLSK